MITIKRTKAKIVNNEFYLLFHGILSLRIQPLLPLLLLALDFELIGGEGTAQGSCLLVPQVLGLEGLFAVKFSQVLFLCLVDHCEDTCHRLAHSVAGRFDARKINKLKVSFRYIISSQKSEPSIHYRVNTIQPILNHFTVHLRLRN